MTFDTTNNTNVYIDPEYLELDEGLIYDEEPTFSSIELPKFPKGHIKAFSGYKKGTKAYFDDIESRYGEQNLFSNI